MIDFMKYTDDELQNLSFDIKKELKRRNSCYKNLVQGVLYAIYKIDDLNRVAFDNGFATWTWEELANSIKACNLTDRFEEED